MDDARNSDVETAIWTQSDEDKPVENDGDSDGQIGETIREFLHAYWQKRVVALSLIAAGIIVAAAYSLLMPNIYRSTTSLMPQDNSSPYSSMLAMVSGSSTAASLGSEALGLQTPSELQISILESRTVLDSMISRFGLMHYYNARVIEDARKALTDNTKIDQDRKSGIITIAVTDTSADFAAKLAQGYVTELNRVLTENSTSAARRERLFLEGRLKQVKQDLDDSSKALSQFSTKTKALDVPAQARSMVEAALRLQAAITDGESQLAALRQTYSEDNYRVKTLEARNAELRRQLNAMGASPGNSETPASANSTYPSVGQLPTLGLTYADLERKVKVDEALWETLVRQYEMARVQEAKEIPTINVLDPANTPSRKTAPNRRTIVFVGAFISFLISGVLVFALWKWEQMDVESMPKRALVKLVKRVANSKGR